MAGSTPSYLDLFKLLYPKPCLELTVYGLISFNVSNYARHQVKQFLVINQRTLI
jgi:hypothetical protein